MWRGQRSRGRRSRFLSGLGFGALDALHSACAENAQARSFVTTDDRLIRKALEQRDQIQLEAHVACGGQRGVTPARALLRARSDELICSA
jgi:hypothetical protein